MRLAIVVAPALCAANEFGGSVLSSINGSVIASDSWKSGICDTIHNVQCFGDDLKDIGRVNTHEACCQACEATPACHAWTWNWKYDGHCWLKSACTDKRIGSDAYQSGISQASPKPVPPAPLTPISSPSPAPAPSLDNPLGIKPLPRRSDNFFLIIGDWGKDGYGGCQRKVAQMMKDYVAKQHAQGKKCLFVGAVGDNFYPIGLQDDAHWERTWSGVYGVNDPSSPLYSTPWLAVMGNHDYGNADPGCACGQGCKQFNGAHRPRGTEKFWMPDYNWRYYIPGVDVEVIGLDTNAVDVGGLGGNGCAGGAHATCQRCGHRMQGFLDQKKREGEQLIDERATHSPAKTVLIMQHYDGGYGAQYMTRFQSRHSAGKAKVLSAYGHAHDQLCHGSRENGCDLILTGGGGGWQGGLYFGFTAVHLTDDGGYRTVLETEEVRLPQRSCVFVGQNATSQESLGSVDEVFV